MARKTYTFVQLRKSVQDKLVNDYRCWVERDDASFEEAKEYFMTMGNGEGGAELFYYNGEEVSED